MSTCELFNQVYKFCKINYKPSRFEMRNGTVWGNDYSTHIAAHHMESITKYGYSLISLNEAASGETIIFSKEDLK